MCDFNRCTPAAQPIYDAGKALIGADTLPIDWATLHAAARLIKQPSVETELSDKPVLLIGSLDNVHAAYAVNCALTCTYQVSQKRLRRTWSGISDLRRSGGQFSDWYLVGAVLLALSVPQVVEIELSDELWSLPNPERFLSSEGLAFYAPVIYTLQEARLQFATFEKLNDC